MFIKIENTPNPLTFKFVVVGEVILESGTMEFKNEKEAAAKSPLALQLFQIMGVESILFGHDFIAVTKTDDYGLDDVLKTEVMGNITIFYLEKKEIIFPQSLQETKKSDDEDSEIVKQIKELIEIKVRPAVAMDGGDITFHSFVDGVVYLVLKGSCSGCPSSTITLKNGIENMLKHYIPEVESVEQIEEN